MIPAQVRIFGVASAAGEAAAGEVTCMLRRFSVAGAQGPLPEDFDRHQEDLKSARGTIERVTEALRRACAAAPQISQQTTP